MKTLVYLLMLFLAVNSFGQYDKEAKQLLDKVSDKTKSFESVEIHFSSVAHNPQTDIDEEYKGILWQKAEKYKLEFMDAITFFDGENKWVYMPDVHEVNLFSVDESENNDNIFDNPQRIFTIYTEDFKYTYGGEVTFNDEKLLLVELIPEKKDVEYFKIKLFVDKETNKIAGIKYFAKDGMRVTITITEYKTNLGLQEKMFSFSKEEHPDAEVIDMRE